MYIGCEETHHSRSYARTHARTHAAANTLTPDNFQVSSQLQIDGVDRAAYVLSSLSLSHRTPSTSLFYCHCFSAACSDQSSISPLFFSSSSPSTSLVLPPPPHTRPTPLRYITGNLYSAWIHLAQWGLNKCVCQTQMAWSQCCRGTEGGMTAAQASGRGRGKRKGPSEEWGYLRCVGQWKQMGRAKAPPGPHIVRQRGDWEGTTDSAHSQLIAWIDIFSFKAWEGSSRAQARPRI